MSLTRRRLVEWLLENGFTELPRKASGHRYFELKGVKTSVPDHGKDHMEQKFVSLLARQLTSIGFDAKKVKSELR